MAKTAVPNFREIWNSVPDSTAPRTLDATIEFLRQLDTAIDLDDANIDVWKTLTSLIDELRELGTNLKAMREGKGAYRTTTFVLKPDHQTKQ